MDQLYQSEAVFTNWLTVPAGEYERLLRHLRKQKEKKKDKVNVEENSLNLHLSLQTK